MVQQNYFRSVFYSQIFRHNTLAKSFFAYRYFYSNKCSEHR